VGDGRGDVGRDGGWEGEGWRMRVRGRGRGRGDD